MEELEHVDEDFVNHQETEGDTDCVAAPVQIEGGRVTSPAVGGKQNGERDQLSDGVGEEELELAEKAASKHERSNAHLKDGMQNPKRVKERLNFFAHAVR